MEEDDASGKKEESGENDSSAESSFVFGQNIKDRAKVEDVFWFRSDHFTLFKSNVA